MLASFGLVELSGDPRVSQHRRPVRASDRLVELASGEIRLDATPVALGTLEQHDLDAVHAEMLSNPGPVQSELADGYVESIAASGKDLWEKFESAIDDMSGTWK